MNCPACEKREVDPYMGDTLVGTELTIEHARSCPELNAYVARAQGYEYHKDAIGYEGLRSITNPARLLELLEWGENVTLLVGGWTVYVGSKEGADVVWLISRHLPRDVNQIREHFPKARVVTTNTWVDMPPQKTGFYKPDRVHLTERGYWALFKGVRRELV